MGPDTLLICWIFLALVHWAKGNEPKPSIGKRKSTFVMLSSALLMATNPQLFASTNFEDPFDMEEKTAPPHRHRKRRHVHSIFEEMGPYYVRRAYRMHAEDFWRLHRMLLPFLPRGHLRTPGSKKTWVNGAKNGVIPSPTRLSCALRYFAGGAVHDIAIAHGISGTEVYESVWMIMNAVNKCPELAIKYPTDYNQQRKIAREFQAKSKAKFPTCAGAIDGILIWIEKPSDDECEAAKCGAKRFFCGRKKKFGLNMQGTCDVHGRFLSIAIGHPGSTSDFLAFSTTKFCHRLERVGFLAPGLCLFGDNAYVNTHFMATPFKSVKEGSKFDYNFFHSNVRIKIECCFGMLVRRWSILRTPISATVGLKKTTALVSCLCRLHNYCINCHLNQNKESAEDADEPEEPSRVQRARAAVATPAPNLAIDEAEIAANGGIPLERRGDNEASPEQLLHGGEHFDDTGPVFRQDYKRLHTNGVLPRDILHGMVAEQNITRPKPVGWGCK